MRPQARAARRAGGKRRSLGAWAVFFVAAASLRRLAYSPRSRLVVLGLLLFDVVAIGALVTVLAPRFTEWGLDGGVVLERRLWLSCLVSWIGSVGLATLAAVQEGFGQKAILTFTLPLPAPTRLRIFYGNVVLQLVNLWIIGGFGFGIAVISALGWQGVFWLALVLAGGALAVLGSLLLLSAWLVYFRPPPSKLRAVAAALLAAGALLATRWVVARWTIPAVTAADSSVLVLVVALGPLAGALGDLHARAFHVTQASGPRAVKRRTMALFTGWLLRFRSLGAALLVKDLLTRSRHWANWGRVFLAAAAVLAFPLLRARLRSLDLDDSLLVTGFVVGGVLLTIVDGASSPFGSEGNRLTLLLTASLRPAQIIRAKMAAFVVPFSLAAIATSTALSLATGLGGGQTVHVCLAVLLMVVGISSVFVLGSVLDVDLDFEMHGGLEGLLYEETPFSPVRLALTGIGTAVSALDLLMLAYLPRAAVHPLLLALDALLLATGLRLATSRLERVHLRENREIPTPSRKLVVAL